MNTTRPLGVVAIVVLCAIVAAASFAFSIPIATGRLPLSAGSFLVGGGFEQLGPLAFVIYGLLSLLLAIGLWKRWSWTRRATILLAVIGIAVTVPAISSAVMDSRLLAIAREGLQIVARVMIVFYLAQDPVKDWFSPTS